MTVIGVGDIELDYERSGAGSPMLLLMGMGGTSLHWGDPFLDPLREDFDLIAYDHRGVGASAPLDKAITVRLLAEDAAGLLTALELDSAHVVGISMGGMVAQELALAHPERVRTLTLGCTYCGGEGSALGAPEVMQRLGEATMSGDRERILRAGFEINVSRGCAEDQEMFARFLEIGNERAVSVSVIMAQLQACMSHDTSARLPSLTMPTLVMHGTADQLLPVQNGRLIASLIPRSRLEIFDGAGHLFFWEQPERSAELVRAHAAVPV
jgi:3-oxoadipate enol-lactonase